MRTVKTSLILVLAAAWLAACNSAGPSSAATDTGPTPTPTVAPAATATRAPAASATTPASAPATRPPATPAPTAAPSTAAPTAAPAATPTPVPAATPTSAPAVSANGCTGSAANKTFFASNSPKVAFNVYCAVLPSGWFLNSGSYTAGNGGSFSIGYKNNAGNQFDLKEGFWCQGVPIECGPYDTAIGTANYGDMQGQLGKKGAQFVLYVKAGQNPAWSATGTGIDEATFRSFASALLKVAK